MKIIWKYWDCCGLEVLFQHIWCFIDFFVWVGGLQSLFSFMTTSAMLHTDSLKSTPNHQRWGVVQNGSSVYRHINLTYTLCPCLLLPNCTMLSRHFSTKCCPKFFSPQRLGGRLFGALLEFIKGGVLAGTLYYIPATASVLCAIFCFFKSVWRAN